MVYSVCTRRLGSDDVAESFSWDVPGSVLACFPLMISTKWIAVQAKGIRYFPSLSQFDTASVRILSLCWNDKKQDKIAFTVQLSDKRKRAHRTNAPFWRTRVQHARIYVRNVWVLSFTIYGHVRLQLGRKFCSYLLTHPPTPLYFLALTSYLVFSKTNSLLNSLKKDGLSVRNIGKPQVVFLFAVSLSMSILH